jgi:hypothetical protein
MNNRNTGKHGKLRGLDSVSSSSIMEGLFGRMFRTLAQANHSTEDLKALATAMVDPSTDPQTPETNNPQDDEENVGNAKSKGISAGYTYLGQFLDHDITFDPTSSLQKQNDPNALEDFRTPRFDLDSLYGRGPDDQPYLYDFIKDGTVKMLLGKTISGNDDPKTKDLPRNNPLNGEPKRALIGDPRNDENVIVSQLHGIFLRFHNSVVDHQKANNLDTSFATVQRIVRWHYQWLILHDFLPTILGEEMVKKVLPDLDKGISFAEAKSNLKFYKWKTRPFMPVEFSVAAYRFGHSMIRPIYRLNEIANPKPDPKTPKEERFFIFPTLVGFGEFPDNLAIDWQLFFDFGNKPDPFSKKRIQPAYKIDTSLVNPLGHLPKSVSNHIPPMPSLAELNLVRGLRLGLPSGQAVAKAMNIPVIPDKDLRIGKATEDGQKPDKKGVINNKLLTDISPNFKDNAPLWFYILAEALNEFQDNQTPIRLGPVGGRIVAEVFIGLLLGDNYSYLNQDPLWKPIESFTTKGRFGIVELITQAKKA